MIVARVRLVRGGVLSPKTCDPTSSGDPICQIPEGMIYTLDNVRYDQKTLAEEKIDVLLKMADPLRYTRAQ